MFPKFPTVGKLLTPEQKKALGWKSLGEVFSNGLPSPKRFLSNKQQRILELQGLRGFGSLSKKDADDFIAKNQELIAARGYDPVYINNLYSNGQYINKFGIDDFKATPGINIRNQKLKDTIVNEVWDKWYSPINDKNIRDNSKGLGSLWEKYSAMSTDSKLKLLESDFLTPSEFEDKWKKYDEEKAARQKVHTESGAGAFMPMGVSVGQSMLSADTGSAAANTLERLGAASGAKEHMSRLNQKIADKIYNDETDVKAAELGSVVGDTYQKLLTLGDDQIKEAFKDAITPSKTNRGIPEYAAFYGDGSDVESEMKDFSVDDMRKVLAKKAVYNQYMDPEMSATALNNEATRYIKDHQSSWTRTGLFAKDVGISILSYLSDKANGLYNAYLIMADQFSGDKPVVWVDDKTNVIDPNKVTQNPDGTYVTKDENGEIHPVHKQEISRSTLHQMGRNLDGSEDTSIWNPQYWSRAEQFGTLDEDLQKKYEQLGVSPYKVVYDPNEDSDIWYESFKMMSFGFGDALSMIVPYGVGQIGNKLSTAGKAGGAIQKIGNTIEKVGKGFQNKWLQGGLGAAGIAHAYERGAFQETLAQNLSNLEENLLNNSRNEIYNLYNSDENYKKEIDSEIEAETSKMKAAYLASLGESNEASVVDEETLDNMLRSRAQEYVLQKRVAQNVEDKKKSEDYIKMQEQAVNGAGKTATMTFLPEALKYGFVNTVGFKKWMYSNPVGIQRQAANVFKGLKEVTTSAGRKRLVGAAKNLTKKEKLAQLGKITASQVWGGAWTNGTDDMMVDAAEMVNADSYNRYLSAYSKGEALADLYGATDGWYSYWRGLSNSLGQETTWNAATVGGLGSIVSFSPNMVNMASLATKKGRQEYKNRYQQKNLYETDANGYKTLKRDEKGNPIVEQIGWKKNFMDRLSFFVQNGVLNNYYGARLDAREMQDHADYVNKILDDYDDFKSIEDLIASDNALQNVVNMGDLKTARFIKAIQTLNALNHLGNNKNDPAAMSSVVNNMKNFIDRVINMSFDANSENSISEEEAKNHVAQYYANNPGLVRNEYNNLKALYNIAQNAQELKEAAQAYEEAEKQVQAIENTRNEKIDSEVREKMKLEHALTNHWKKRVSTMKEEIGDNSSEDISISDDKLLASYGGREKAESTHRIFIKQRAELLKEVEEKEKIEAQKQEAVEKALEKLNELEEKDNESEETLSAKEAYQKALEEKENATEEVEYYKDLLSISEKKEKAIADALVVEVGEEKKTKPLTADEIMALDPVTRARMLNPENRGLYNKEQRREIEKLEKELLSKDGNALEKIQDIALLSQRIESSKDAFKRMADNPKAAAVNLEMERQLAANIAHNLINYRNAETAVSMINEFIENTKTHKDVTKEAQEQVISNVLRKLNPVLLDTIDEHNLLPEHTQLVRDAKEWGEVVGDISAVITESDWSEEEKENVFKNINTVIESARNKEEIVKNLEDVIDTIKDSQITESFEKVLQDLEELGYQRDATVLENRKQRREKEEIERINKIKAEEEAKLAAEKAVKEAAEKKRQEEEALKQKTSFTYKIQKTSRSGKQIEGAYIGEYKDSTIHVKRRGAGIRISHNELLDSGFTADDIAGKKEDWRVNNMSFEEFAKEIGLNGIPANATEEEKKAYNKELESARKQYEDLKSFYEDIVADMSFTIDAIHITDNGNVTIESTDLAGTITGRTAERILKIFAPELKEQIDALKTRNTEEEAIPEEKTEGEEQEEIEKEGTEKDTEGNKSDEEVVISEETNSQEEDEDTIYSTSPSLEEQLSEEGEKASISDQTTDVAAINAIGEHNIEHNSKVLSANEMAEYESAPLQEKGALVHKQGKEVGDSMSQFYAWMGAEGIKLQNIIDMELSHIFKMNPQAKIKFMVVRPEKNATNDIALKRKLFLVLDYDDNINKAITKIHDDSNGGVIESNGKKYLIVGVASKGNNNAEALANYDILFSNNPKSEHGYGLARRGMGEYFRNNPSERFYIPEGLYTEYVQNSLIPGYLVKQLETDEANGVHRSVLDLVKDKKSGRNPLNIEFENLAWGIQMYTKFHTIGTTLDKVMVPQDIIRNAGSAFVLVPASNGKFLPSYIVPLKWTEIKRGSLKNKTDKLLSAVTAPKFEDRYKAVIELCNIFYLDKDHDCILLRKNKNEISLAKDGVPFKTFVLDNLDSQEFLDAFAHMNPRINITSSVLSNHDRLLEYNEAGALQVDIARLATAGSSYSIYPLNPDGSINRDEGTSNTVKASNNDFRTNNLQIIYEGQYYYYDAQERVYKLDGENVKDSKTIEQLDYSREILERNLTPIEETSISRAYLLEEGEHPKVIRVNRNSKKAKVLPEDQAKALIEKFNKQVEERKRKLEAGEEIEKLEQREREMREALEKGNIEYEDVDLSLGEEAEEVREVIIGTEEEDTGSTETSNNETPKREEAITPVTSAEVRKTTTQSFKDLATSKKHRIKVLNTIKKKWSDAPSKISDLAEFLKKKNVEVDAIGTSDLDVQAWIATIEDCR